ncbi:hypothetical protein GUJ93_ZPchr0001g29453 [Zizania palustris]|uniref:Uncharacterized protein n=1 Tax=Zizania palustris TaxID=103762 RepID=A0A8J5RRG3_ZIZPA|nr:hypothetical protein GUJ93_ZPchr0001g29453 [Zizania palustris]
MVDEGDSWWMVDEKFRVSTPISRGGGKREDKGERAGREGERAGRKGERAGAWAEEGRRRGSHGRWQRRGSALKLMETTEVFPVAIWSFLSASCLPSTSFRPGETVSPFSLLSSIIPNATSTKTMSCQGG